MSKQFVNNVSSVAILATCWHEVPLPPLEGEVPNEREAEGFVRRLSVKTPQSALPVPKSRQVCQLPFQGRPWQNLGLLPFIQLLSPVSCGQMLSAPTERVQNFALEQGNAPRYGEK